VFGQLLSLIETGNNSWLRVASMLKPAADAGASEGLNGALSIALVKRPQEVLRVFR